MNCRQYLISFIQLHIFFFFFFAFLFSIAARYCATGIATNVSMPFVLYNQHPLQKMVRHTGKRKKRQWFIRVERKFIRRLYFHSDSSTSRDWLRPRIEKVRI